MTVLVVALVVVAVVLVEGSGASEAGPPGPDPERPRRRPWRRRSRPAPTTAGDVADLAERMAGLARAGLPEIRTWQALAEHGGRGGAIAEVVATVGSVGGRTSEGLRLAAQGLDPAPAAAVTWLALAADVVERTGAPSAAVHDRITTSIRSEVAALDEQLVATAGARSTAGVLSALPAAGIVLGGLLGVNVIGTLLGTTPGRACLLLGATLWWLGRRWSTTLVRRASVTGPTT